MSIDENSNETENQAVPESSNEAINQAPASQSAEPASNPAAGIVATLLDLKESNPKVFFGGIGAVVLVLLVLVMSGGDDPRLPAHQAKAMVPGQNYVLKSPNTYDPNATVRLVSVPGSMAAYDDTEENDREGACKHMPMNTSVKLLQSQNDSTDKNLVWAEVEITADGECLGKRAWTSSVNLQ
ncbi:MAG: hypothetical protein PHH11_12800 [Methylomonas sp.]|nr:hypothetical protein [Methylomonas sp.]